MAARRRQTPKRQSGAQSRGSRVLLDTHVFLWAASDPERLSGAARDAIEDPANDVFISSAVIWEIVIKYALGKLQLPAPPASYLPPRLRDLGFRELPIKHEHALTLTTLPMHHRDSFDRMLIAQARFEGMTLITADPHVALYDLKFLTAATVAA